MLKYYLGSFWIPEFFPWRLSGKVLEIPKLLSFTWRYLSIKILAGLKSRWRWRDGGTNVHDRAQEVVKDELDVLLRNASHHSLSH